VPRPKGHASGQRHGENDARAFGHGDEQFYRALSFHARFPEAIASQLPDVFRAIGSTAGSLFGSPKTCKALPIALTDTNTAVTCTVQVPVW
jgi:hypothetical protein